MQARKAGAERSFRIGIRRIRALLMVAAAVVCMPASGESLSLSKGYIGIASYLYPETAGTDQENGNLAVVVRTELDGDLGSSSYLRVTPLLRLDAIDNERNKFDLQDAYVEQVFERWGAVVGMRMLAWSVTESVNVIPHHVVDIINQRDLAADPAGKEKLGTPMLSLSYNGDNVFVEGFVLPYFREREFPSEEAREHPFRGQVDLRNAGVAYTDSSDEWRTAFVLRGEVVAGSANMAYIFYQGYMPQPVTRVNAEGKAEHLYYLVNMNAITVQAALGAWLIKTETGYFDTSLNNDGFSVPSSYWSSVSGVEYTFIRPEETSDLSVIFEWMYDSRGDGDLGVQFQNDAFVGVRWVANDFDGSEAIVGVVSDAESRANVFHAQYERRLSSAWRIELIGRLYAAEEKHPFAQLENDTLIYGQIKYSF